jgi:uncharacterized membrane protein YdjX (TVP38/TMEM64 family)
MINPDKRPLVHRESQRADALQSSGRSSSKLNARWRPLALLFVIAMLLLGAKVFGLGERLGELRNWINSLGAWGPVVFVFLYIGAVVAAIPGSALTVTAGALFGSVFGVVVVSVGSTVGAGLAFLIARYLARDATARWLVNNEKFRMLDQLTRERGAIIVALARLVPLFPFNLLNYGFGLTGVSFWTYLFWSWLCMLPGTVLYVVGADAFTSGLAHNGIPWGLIIATVVVGVMLTILVRYARQKLKDKGVET